MIYIHRLNVKMYDKLTGEVYYEKSFTFDTDIEHNIEVQDFIGKNYIYPMLSFKRGCHLKDNLTIEFNYCEDKIF